MNPAYFTTLFDPHGFGGPWPESFAIINAWATTGEAWPIDQCKAADEKLRSRLEQLGVWHQRITGYAPDNSHAEPSWAVVMEFDAACDLGVEFLQTALYMVEGDNLFVSYCDERRARIRVGPFRERVKERGL